MVRDNVTGLIWEMKNNMDGVQDYSNPQDADNTYTWYDSNPATNGGDAGVPGDGTDTEDFINTLNTQNYGGHHDWRMPTIKELTLITNKDTFNPAFNTFYFPNTQVSSGYWSSTGRAYHPVSPAWIVSFLLGNPSYGGSKSSPSYVRAVRGGQYGENNFIDNADGTVTDTFTGLMWQKDTAPGTYTWEQALAYCEKLVLNNDGTWSQDTPNASGIKYDDWRLPNANELQSLVDYSRYYPALPQGHPFTNVQSVYWSSTPCTYHPGYNMLAAWSFNIDEGMTGVGHKQNYYYAWPVRAGQCGGLGDLPLFVQPFSQNDDRWKGEKLGECSSCTIGSDGCAVTSLAMVTNYFNPCYTNPEKLNTCLTNANEFGFCPTGAGKCCLSLDGTYPCSPNVTFEKITSFNNDTECRNKIIASLNSGWPVIVRVSNFHFIVMYNYDETSLYFMDPWDGKAKTWPHGAPGDGALGEYSFTPYEIIICHGIRSCTGSRCDGLPRTELFGLDGTDPNYDGNGDTLPDWQQSNVSSFHNYDRQSYVTLEASPETTLTNVQAVDNPSLADVPLYVDFRQQFFSFTINNVKGGLIAKLHLLVGTSINTYYKYGPTPDNPMFHWYEFMYDGQTHTGALINDNIVTLYFIDGQRGDDDLTPNGTIIDVGGPGIEGEETVVTMSSFNVRPKDANIVLVWKTESEINNAGFNLYRSEVKDGKYSRINTALIPAKGSSTQGASYEFVDIAVQNRKTYWYKLEDVDFSGKSTLHGPISATPRLIYGNK